jgi:cytosine/adenosine deaminase-related metal-dependent hydrolase
MTQTKMPPLATDFAIEAGWILTLEHGVSRLLRDGHAVISHGRFTDIRPGPFRGDLACVSVPNDILLPGFISGHTHVASGTPTRGIIEGAGSSRPPAHAVAALSDQELDDLTAYNLAEVLRSGCTTQLEMSQNLRHTESYVRVALKWGVRGYPGGMIPGTPRVDAVWARTNDDVLLNSVPDTLAEIESNRRFGLDHMNAGGGLIKPMLAPHATDTHTPETMRAMKAAADQLGTGIHFHIAQSDVETERVRRMWGKTPVEWIETFGMFEAPVFGAHMTALDWRTDPAILNDAGAVYVHCPSAGGAGGATQPYPEALGAGMNVNIGLDTHSNDYVENMKLAVIAGRARGRLVDGHHPGPIRLPAIEDAISGATTVAAKGLGRDDLGRIAPGAFADFTTVDLTGFLVGGGALPPEPLHNLLYANGLSVRHVATAGRFQVFDGHLVVDDESEVRARGGAVLEKIWKTLGSGGYLTN